MPTDPKPPTPEMIAVLGLRVKHQEGLTYGDWKALAALLADYEWRCKMLDAIDRECAKMEKEGERCEPYCEMPPPELLTATVRDWISGRSTDLSESSLPEL